MLWTEDPLDLRPQITKGHHRGDPFIGLTVWDCLCLMSLFARTITAPKLEKPYAPADLRFDSSLLRSIAPLFVTHPPPDPGPMYRSSTTPLGVACT